MYLRKIHIENIRSIQSLTLEFPPGQEAGWHVLIGDNGSGKTSFIRAVALAMIGPEEAKALREDWNEWLTREVNIGGIRVDIIKDSDDKFQSPSLNRYIPLALGFQRDGLQTKLMPPNSTYVAYSPEYDSAWSNNRGWFSASYGPLRRFRGGDESKSKLFKSNPRTAAHISAFGEDAALTEIESWLQQLHFQRLEEKQEAKELLNNLSTFFNQGGLLPHNAKLRQINTEGILFEDGNGKPILINELSDGYRSVLSLTFELVRQLVITYGQKAVFPESFSENPIINLPGVVLIDEIDAHLHPTWQVRIGQWFTKYFPKLQFIVTTHSPLICRAAVKGSVWRLAAPGTEEQARQITGIELQRLIYGNVLEAYGTEVFGEGVSNSPQAIEKRERLAELSKKSIKGTITESESEELQEIKAVLPIGG